jgi:hypothetical protein
VCSACSNAIKRSAGRSHCGETAGCIARNLQPFQSHALSKLQPMHKRCCCCCRCHHYAHVGRMLQQYIFLYSTGIPRGALSIVLQAPTRPAAVLKRHNHILEVTPVTSPVWGANDRLIGRPSNQADQRTQEAKRKPQALPELILVVIIHQIAKRLLMSQVDQMN